MADYGNVMGISCPGALGDSSEYNIDATCVVEEHDVEYSVDSRNSVYGEILCGKIVHVSRIVDGYKEISSSFEVRQNGGSKVTDIAYGVAFSNPLATYRDPQGKLGYAPGEPISVVTHGRVWVLTELPTAPTPQSDVYVTERGYASNEGQIEVWGWTFTGRYERYAEGYHIVEVQVKQSTGHMVQTHFKKVNGIKLTKSSEGNLKYDTPIIVTAEVSPADATDKTGSWSLDDSQKGTLNTLNDAMVRFTPTKSFVGDVHINWEANDGSGVRGMVKVTYIP